MWLLLDVGSTTVKRMLLEHGRITEITETVTPPNVSPIPGRYEIDGERLFQTVLEMLRPAASETLAGVLLSTQMHGFLLSDADGRPMTPFVSWQDRAALEPVRGESTIEALRKIIPAGPLFRAGVPLKPNLGLVSLAARVRQGLKVPEGTLFHSLGGYLLYRLCGQHVCHMTNAAPCGIADVTAGRLNEPLIAAAGLAGLRYPRLLSGYAPCGTARVAGRCFPVYPDLGDQQLCLLGTPCRPESGYHINIGTAGLTGMLTRRFEAGAYENRAWLDKKCYLRTVSGLPGGRSIAALHQRLTARGLGEEQAWALMTGARGKPEKLNWQENALLPDLPDSMSGEEWCVSVYEAMAKKYRCAAAQMKCTVREVYFSGGCILKNPALRRAMEAVFPAARAFLCGVEQGAVALAKRVQIQQEDGTSHE